MSESMRTIVITITTLAVIGLVFLTVGDSQVTSRAVQGDVSCFDERTGSPVDAFECCSRIKQSTGCYEGTSEHFEDTSYLCKGLQNVIVTKEAIRLCQSV